MLRFCDKEVYTFYESDLITINLYSYFCQRGHQSDVLLVYNDDQTFQGIITYERLLYHKELLIQRQYLLTGEDIFEEAKILFEQDKSLVFLPVLNHNRELLYFCYKSKLFYEKVYRHIMQDFYENDYLLFISEFYPKVQAVFLYDMNEIAYLFYKLLQKRGFPTVVTGEKWSEILGIKTAEIQCPSFCRIEIYAEGTPFIQEDIDFHNKRSYEAPNSWHFLYRMALGNHIIIENLFRREALALNRTAYICRIPMLDQLDQLTLEEDYRDKNQITLWNKYLDLNNKLVQKQLSNLYQMPHKEAIDLLDIPSTRKRFDELINSQNIRYYGNGKNKIYLIGPCIVEAYFTFPKDELVNYLYPMLQKHFGNDYSIVAITVSEHQMSPLKELLYSLPISEKDIVLFINQSHHRLCVSYQIEDEVDLDLLDLYNHRPKKKPWFVESPVHTTGYGNKAIAETLLNGLIVPDIERQLNNNEIYENISV